MAAFQTCTLVFLLHTISRLNPSLCIPIITCIITEMKEFRCFYFSIFEKSSSTSVVLKFGAPMGQLGRFVFQCFD